MRFSPAIFAVSFLAASARAVPVPEVVVTAERAGALTLGNLLTTSSIITRDEIRSRQYQTVYQALRDVPGVDVVATSPGQTASLFIRGEKSEQALVLVDGVEYNDPTDPGRGADLSGLRMENVERIEVIRGAQSVLYPGVGGVILIVTRSGRGGPAATQVGAEAGSFGTARADIATRGATPSGFDYAIAAGVFRTDGISAAAHGAERDGAKTLTFSGKLGKQLDDRTRVELVTRYFDAKTDLDLVPRDTPDFRASQQNLLARLAATRRYDGWEPTLSVDYRGIDRQSLNVGVTPATRFLSTGDIVKVSFLNRIAIGDRHLVTAGVETERHAARIDTDYGFGRNVTDRRVLQSDAVAQYELSSDDGPFLVAGLRADYHGTFGCQPTYRAAPGWKWAATGTTVRAALGTGFKAPSLYHLYGEYGSTSLRPEKSFSVDIGIEQSVVRDRWAIVLTGFRNALTDMVDFDTATNRYVNVGRARTEGVELTSAVLLFTGVKLVTAYTFLEATDENTGLQLLRRPRHRVSNTLVYAAGPWEAALTHQLVGRRVDLDAATFARKELETYNVFHAAVSYRLFAETTLTARVENLLDSRYVVIDGYGVPGISGYVGIRQSL